MNKNYLVLLLVIATYAYALPPGKGSPSKRFRKASDEYNRGKYKSEQDFLEKNGSLVGDISTSYKIGDMIDDHTVCRETNPKVRVGLFWKKSIFNYDMILNDHQDKIQNLPNDCKEQFIKNFLAYKIQEEKTSVDEFCKQSSCDLVLKVTQAQNELVNVITQPDISNLADVKCTPIEKNSVYQELEKILSEVENIKECSELKVGEYRIGDGVLGRVAQNYKVKKTDANAYELSFNINFLSNDSQGISGEQMREKVNACVKWVNKRARGPNKEKLNFVILDPNKLDSTQMKKAPPRVVIAIQSKGGRANSASYPADIKCPTVMHELMHLAGLCDEYKETVNGMLTNTKTGETYRVNNENKDNIGKEGYKLSTDYNHCRSISTKPSLMSNQYEVINSIYPTTLECNCGNPEKPESFQEQTCRRLMTGDEAVKKFFINSNQKLGVAIRGFHRNCTTVRQESLISVDSAKEIKNARILTNYLKTKRTRTFTKNSFYGSAERFGGIIGIRYECSCNEGDKNCLKDLEALDKIYETNEIKVQTACPFGFKNVGQYSEMNEKAKPKYENSLLVTPDVEPLPLLRPAHLEKILYPGCDSKAPKYTKCAEYAYKRSGETCYDRPEYCKDETLWLDSTN